MCNCIELANKQLAADNTQIYTRQTLDFATGKESDVLQVPTMKIDSKKRAPAKAVFATFCPFCGDRLALT